jgi:hypothetical protein
MDYLRTAYSTKMRLWADRPDEVTVNWFRADPGAEVFPGPQSFTSRVWLDPGYVGIPLAIGETLAPRPYNLGVNIAGLRGSNHCGRDQAFITGGVTGVDPEIPVLPDGSSACCDGVAEQEPQELLVSGVDTYGNSDDVFLIVGGEDSVVALTPLMYGPTPVPNVDATFTTALGFNATSITITNTTGAAATLRLSHAGPVLSQGSALMWDISFPPNSITVICCDYALSQTPIHYVSNTNNALNLTLSGFIYS